MNNIIAVDIGTTHIKSLALNDQGECIRLLKHNTPLTPEPGGGCYHSEEIWQIVRGQIAELLQEQQCRKGCRGISVTGMAEAGLIVNRSTGAALTEIIPWFDERPKELAETLDLNQEELFDTTGLRKSYKYGIYKFLWLMQTKSFPVKELMWLSVCEYIVYRFTGRMITEPTLAARSYVYHIKKRQWDEERIHRYGLAVQQFPQLVESGQRVGDYHGIPVALAGHDHVLAAYCLLFEQKDRIVNSAGTAETYLGLLKEDQLRAESGLLYGPFVDQGYYFMASIPSSGHAVEWFRRQLQMKPLSYEEMNQSLEALADGPTGLLYFPYLTGMGTPCYNPEISGGLLGLRQDHNGSMILKGILEGISYQAKWLLSIVKEYHGIEGEKLICAGGSVHNQCMMQIKADVLPCSVAVPQLEEATLLGAAALFLQKNVGQTTAARFLQKPLQVKKAYLPESKQVTEYEKLYLKWRKLRNE